MNNATLTRRIALAAALAWCSTAAQAALKEGDTAPRFAAPASLAGKAFSFSLDEALKKGPVVVYFYPAAFTQGCSIQAHAFAVRHERFAAAGASIVGVSLDTIAQLNAFSADPNFCAGKFPVAADPGGRIAKSYELRVTPHGSDPAQGYAERSTFVVMPDGRIAATIGGVAPEENVERALQAVQKIGASRR